MKNVAIFTQVQCVCNLQHISIESLSHLVGDPTKMHAKKSMIINCYIFKVFYFKF